MWLFSDKDITQAAKAAIKDLKSQEANKEERKTQVDEFIKAFDDSRNFFKDRSEPIIQWDIVRISLEQGLARNPKHFGWALGALYGFFKFYPELISTINADEIIACANALKDKPLYHKFIQRVIGEWKPRVEDALRMFREPVTDKYHRIVREI